MPDQPRTFGDLMNAQLRELRGTTVNRELPEDEMAARLTDAIRNERTTFAVPPEARAQSQARYAKPVGPERSSRPGSAWATRCSSTAGGCTSTPWSRTPGATGRAILDTTPPRLSTPRVGS
jgi:hypothetical protein